MLRCRFFGLVGVATAFVLPGIREGRGTKHQIFHDVLLLASFNRLNGFGGLLTVQSSGSQQDAGRVRSDVGVSRIKPKKCRLHHLRYGLLHSFRV